MKGSDTISFNSEEYFESRDIQSWNSGKNVTTGWINIQCLFPHCGDHSNHLGISPQDFFNCHYCGESGHVTKLITMIDKCDWSQADRIYKAFSSDEIEEPKIKKALPTGIKLPGTIEIPKQAKNYLKKRRFDPGYLINKYGLRHGGIVGDYKYRLIIPFYMDGKLVSFTSLDTTGKQSLKYKHQKKDDAIIHPANALYNIDSVKDRMIVVEGVTDVWRIGDGCVSTQGKIVNSKQKNILLRKGVKEALVFSDSDAVDVAKKIAAQLSLLIPSVEYIEYEVYGDIDPDSLTEDIVRELRKNFF